ncbi:MRC1 protein, partial [Polypterus senegalus]|nr:MRC1 protein [Polypterus senegalus]
MYSKQLNHLLLQKLSFCLGIFLFCIPDSILLISCSGNDFYFVPTPMTWNAAQSFCRISINSDLVTVTSEDMHQQLVQISRNYSYYNYFWVGLYNDRNNWKWSNGDNINYSNWKRNLFCAYIKADGSWMDTVCEFRKTFICYKETNNISGRYFWINESITWSSAQNYCRVNYTDLVSIRNESENEKIMKEAQGSPFWIGLFNDGWTWSDGGNSAFRNWDLNWHLNTEDWTSELCGMIRVNGGWNVYRCSYRSFFFCSNMLNISMSCTITYIFVSVALSWYDAQKYCRSNYTDLVTVDNQAVNNQVIQVNANNGWIGLRHGNDTWQWSNGDKITYTKWRPSRYCAQVQSDGSWRDSSCSEQISFMCYNESSNVNEAYVWINQIMNWSSALQYCQTNYTDLVSIRNDSENEMLKNKAQGSPFWIGLFNNPWKWSDGGISTLQIWNLYFWIWEADEICGLATSFGKWLEIPCSTPYSFFCSNSKNLLKTYLWLQ